MTTSPFVTPHHRSAGGHQPHDAPIPARRLGRVFVPAPVHTGPVAAPVHTDPVAVPDPAADQIAIADAVLQLLKSVNRNATRQF
jgi:hypothetical protein